MAQQKESVRISLRVSPDEAESIRKKARECGYGTPCKDGAATYTKNVVLGYAPKSVFDNSVMIEMCKVHADLGRVGGLIRKAINDGLMNGAYDVHIADLQKLRRELKWLISDIREGKHNAK